MTAKEANDMEVVPTFSQVADHLEAELRLPHADPAEAHDQALLSISGEGYRFAQANTQPKFVQELLDAFLAEILHWSGKKLDTTHASTPQIRVFQAGDYRSMMREEVNAAWHYLLPIHTAGEASLDILHTAARRSLWNSLRPVRRSVRRLCVNELIVHAAHQPYRIAWDQNQPGQQRLILLDGYLW